MAEQIMMGLFRISLISAVMTVTILLVRALAGARIKAGFLSTLWLMVLVRLVLPVTVESPISVNPALWVRPASGPTETVKMPDADSAAVSPLIFEGEAEEAALADEPVVKPESRRMMADLVEKYWCHALAATWLIGAGLFFILTVMRMKRFRKHVLLGRSLEDKWLYATIISYKYWLGIRRDIRLMESPLVDVPVVMGVFRPVIILPQGLTVSLDQNQLKVIIFHELCHIKRHDLLKNTVWLIGRGLHWFNPFVLLAYRAYLADAEQACDAMVLSALDKSGVIVYSEALVAVMRRTRLDKAVPALVSFCKNSSHLRKRVTDMLKPKKKPAAVSALVVILMLVMAVGSFTTACMKGTEGSVTNIEANSTDALEAIEVTAEDLSSKKTIRVDPVETPEGAIEIARRFNISGADNFIYKGLNTGVLDVHMVSTDDDTNTDYTIYAINGEILRAQSDINRSDQPISISEDQAKVHAETYAKEYYGDVALTIETCEMIVNSGFMITGAIYKDSEGSTRNFFIEINGEGKLISIMAIYDELYALSISDEMVAKVMSYAIDIDEPLRLMGKFQEFGVQIYEFYFEEGSMMVDLNAEDGSLVRISIGGRDIGDTFTMDNDKAKGVALDYIARYFPEATDVMISDQESKSGAAMYKGTLNKGSQAYIWDVAFNNEAELWEIGIKRDYDYSTMEKLDIDEVEEMARENVKEECTFINTDSLVLIKAYESESKNTPDLYMYEFSYTSKNPSVTNFSFTAEAGVNKYSGAFGTLRIVPSTEGIEVLSKEELIDKAKGYLNEAFNVDPDDLKFREMSLVGNRLLEYDLSFDFSEYVSYGCNMIADTGELDGVGESSMLPMPAGMTEDQLGYDQVARLTGDYIDQEITYYNKTANEKYTFIVDNPFCWVMDSAPWNETGEKDVSNSSIGYSEYIDILGCHIVKTETGLTLYYEDVAYLIETDPHVFDMMVDMIKGE